MGMLAPSLYCESNNFVICIGHLYTVLLDVCSPCTEFVTGLLNNVGTHIDPTKLIQVNMCVCWYVCASVCVRLSKSCECVLVICSKFLNIRKYQTWVHH